MNSVCGTDCTKCPFAAGCPGCGANTACQLSRCCHGKGQETCTACQSCELRTRLLAEINALAVPGMEKVTELFALKGFYVNLEYTLPNGTTAKLLQDDAVYLGNQLHKAGTDRCYGLACDNERILVCEYGENGADPEIVIYKRR